MLSNTYLPTSLLIISEKFLNYKKIIFVPNIFAEFLAQILKKFATNLDLKIVANSQENSTIFKYLSCQVLKKWPLFEGIICIEI